jgi:hypothetical protein
VIPLVLGASIPNRPMFRYTQNELAEMQTQVTDLLKHGLIQKSISPFGAPVLFVKKKTGEMRMYVDRDFEVICSIIGQPVLLDAARFGAGAHRL